MPGYGKLRLKSRDGGYFVSVMGDQDTITGFLLSGVGNVDPKRQKNFFLVTSKTTQNEIEQAFKALTNREDVGVLLITQNVAEEIRYLVSEYDKLVPTIIEIPSKDHPYNPEKDSVMQRIYKMTGQNR